MAFVNKGSTNKVGDLTFKSATNMTIGESVTGYYVGIDKAKYPYISLQTKDGEKIALSLSGNLTYIPQDTVNEANPNGKYVVGQLTRITKTGTRPSKRDASKTVAVFSIEQDADDVMVLKTNASQADLQEKVRQMRQGTTK